MQKVKCTACYPLEFKRDAIRLASEPGRTTKGVAEVLGVHPNQITRWKRDLGSAAGQRAPVGRKTPEQVRIRWLTGELDRMRDERDILKKARAFFGARRRTPSVLSKRSAERTA
jgi:transposase